MDIASFHAHFIQAESNDPWAEAMRRLCDHRDRGELTAAPAQEGASHSTGLGQWDVWYAQSSSTQLALWSVWHAHDDAAPVGSDA